MLRSERRHRRDRARMRRLTLLANRGWFAEFRYPSQGLSEFQILMDEHAIFKLQSLSSRYARNVAALTKTMPFSISRGCRPLDPEARIEDLLDDGNFERAPS